MGKTQEMERLAAICRSMHLDDDVDETLSELDLIEAQLLIKKAERQIEESRLVRLESQQLHSKVDEMLKQVEVLKAKKKSNKPFIQVITMRIPLKSHRKLVKSA